LDNPSFDRWRDRDRQPDRRNFILVCYAQAAGMVEDTHLSTPCNCNQIIIAHLTHPQDALVNNSCRLAFFIGFEKDNKTFCVRILIYSFC
jgi:hypothetical protein